MVDIQEVGLVSRPQSMLRPRLRKKLKRRGLSKDGGLAMPD